MLYQLLWGRAGPGGLFYGAAVHFRVYPVIYALPLLVFLHHEHYPFIRKPSEITSMWQTAIVRFFFMAGVSFCALGGASYAFYGEEFLDNVRLSPRFRALSQVSTRLRVPLPACLTRVRVGARRLPPRDCPQAYRYHWSRTDHRHNFAAEFYYEYLHLGRPPPERSDRFFQKLPQSIATFLFGMLNSRDPPWCFFISTMAFVTFNPVVRGLRRSGGSRVTVWPRGDALGRSLGVAWGSFGRRVA